MGTGWVGFQVLYRDQSEYREGRGVTRPGGGWEGGGGAGIHLFDLLIPGYGIPWSHGRRACWKPPGGLRAALGAARGPVQEATGTDSRPAARLASTSRAGGETTGHPTREERYSRVPARREGRGEGGLRNARGAEPRHHCSAALEPCWSSPHCGVDRGSIPRAPEPLG